MQGVLLSSFSGTAASMWLEGLVFDSKNVVAPELFDEGRTISDISKAGEGSWVLGNCVPECDFVPRTRRRSVMKGSLICSGEVERLRRMSLRDVCD